MPPTGERKISEMTAYSGNVPATAVVPVVVSGANYKAQVNQIWPPNITTLLSNSQTVDPPNIAAGAIVAIDLTLNGAQIGQLCGVVPPNTLEAGLYLLAPRVTSANTVTAYIWNSTTSAIDPASGTWIAYVLT
ncbi:MAG: hypothetical protein N2045_13645 [Fimbriimonadales bacterium]|nr:hypothetical protein [Fimbriimonadales bacterium]